MKLLTGLPGVPRLLRAGLPFLAVACGALATEEEQPRPARQENVPGSPSHETHPPPPSSTPSTCPKILRSEDEAREGTPALPAVDQKPCTFKDYDVVGAVLSVKRTFDTQQRVLTEAFDRLDEPPRVTVYDEVYAPPPRHERRTHQYDGAGRLTNTWLDVDANGTNDQHQWWSFDGDGNEVTVGFRRKDDEMITTRTFMPGGGAFLLAEATTRRGDPASSTTFTRRPDGAPLTRVVSFGGNLDSSATWTYDATGASTMIVISAHSVATTTTDAMGRVLESRVDQPKDGVDDYIRTYTYDAAGRLVLDRMIGAKGEPYDSASYTYDASGRLVEQRNVWGHGDSDELRIEVERRAYGACGQVASIERTTNGKPDSRVLRVHDARGYVVSEETRSASPTPKAEKKERTFDAQGRVTQIVTSVLDGTSWKLQTTETRTFDANGRLTGVIVTSPVQTTQTEAFQYDPKGRLVLHERTASSPGAIVREELDYSCLP